MPTFAIAVTVSGGSVAITALAGEATQPTAASLEPIIIIRRSEWQPIKTKRTEEMYTLAIAFQLHELLLVAMVILLHFVAAVVTLHCGVGKINIATGETSQDITSFR